MKRVLFLLAILLVIIPSVGAQGQNQQVRAAIDAINQAIPGIGEPDFWEFSFSTTNSTNLGCNLVQGTALSTRITAYRVILTYDSTQYVYYVAEDLSIIVACDARLLATTTPLATATIAPAACLLQSSVNAAFVRTSPSTAAETLGTAPANRQYTVIGRLADNSWYQIQYSPTQIGWIGSTVATVSGNCQNVPVVAGSGTNIVPTLAPTSSGNSGTTLAIPAGMTCPANFAGYLTPRIALGDDSASVGEGVFISLRSSPSPQSPIVANASPETILTNISAGPACSNGLVWWLVEMNGIQGWIPESNVSSNTYYLIPSAGNGLSEVVRITASNMGQLAEVARLELTAFEMVWISNGIALTTSAGVEFFTYPELLSITAINDLLAIPETEDRASALAFNSTQNVLAVGYTSGTIRLVDLTATVVFELPNAHRDTITALAFNGHGLLASTSGFTPPTDDDTRQTAGSLKVWDSSAISATLPIRFELSLNEPIFDVALLDTYVAITTEQRIRVYDAGIQAEVANYQFETPTLFGKVEVGHSWWLDNGTPGFFFTDGDRLRTLTIDPPDSVGFFQMEGTSILSFSYTPFTMDIPVIALAGESGQFQLISGATEDTLSYDFSVVQVAFRQDGGTLAVLRNSDNRVEFWEIPE